jgi:hypothetical protein
MIPPIILSGTDSGSAQADFKHWLNDEPAALLVVPGNHLEAMAAFNKANEQVNSGSANIAGVRLIHAPDATFIIPMLKNLKIAPGIIIDWSNFSQYAILSITNKYNNIAAIVPNNEIMVHTGGIISQMVLDTLALDKPL